MKRLSITIFKALWGSINEFRIYWIWFIRIVAVQQGKLMATAFHPELTDDLRWHLYFLRSVIRDKEAGTARWWQGQEQMDRWRSRGYSRKTNTRCMTNGSGQGGHAMYDHDLLSTWMERQNLLLWTICYICQTQIEGGWDSYCIV